MSTIFGDRFRIKNAQDNVLIEFNAPSDGYLRWWCDLLEGWDNTADLDISIGNFGLRDGGFPANRFPAKERYITAGGVCAAADRYLSEKAMADLVSALPASTDLFIERDEAIPKRMKIRLASAIEFPQRFEQEFRWLATLMAADPVKESVMLRSAYTNTFAGGMIYREWSDQVNGRTNFAMNAGFESDVTTAVSKFGNPTITKVNTPVKSGANAMKIVTDGTSGCGIAVRTPDRDINTWEPTNWAASIAVRGNGANETIETWIRAYYSDGSMSDSPRETRTLSTTYVTYAHTVTPDPDKVIRYFEIMARSAINNVITYYVDTVVINPGNTSTPYFSGGSYPPNSFWSEPTLPNISPSSMQANPYAPGSRIWDESYTRAWSQAAGAEASGEQVIESVAVVNEGNTTAFPISTVTGPLYSSAWELRNETTEQRLSFRIDIPEGQDLVIDHKEQRAIINGQEITYRKDGDWWGLIPGENVLRLASDEFNLSANVNFKYRDTWRN